MTSHATRCAPRRVSGPTRASHRRSGTLAALVAATAVWLAAALGVGQMTETSPFSHDELARLNAGQLVTRSSTEERGSLRLMGGASWQRISAPPDVVFKALLDVRRYARMLPAVTGSKVVTEQPGARVIRLEHKKGPIGLSYDLRAHVYPDRRDITFGLEDAPGGAPRAAWGFFSVRPYGDNETLLAYGAMTDPGEGILVGLMRGLVHEWILRVPHEVKRFVESPEGHARYGY